MVLANTDARGSIYGGAVTKAVSVEGSDVDRLSCEYVDGKYGWKTNSTLFSFI
jgi:hypothetical protein